MGISFISLDLISIFYVLISVKVGKDLYTNRESLLNDTVTRKDRALLTQAAFFFLIPFGVLLHELGHAMAVWYAGGEVKEFQWRIFWGYVLPGGEFTKTDIWWIALCGNLVSIFLGLLPIPFLRSVNKPYLRELLSSFVKIELLYSLIVYPLFSIISFGDWAKIYDFSVKPYAQITIVIHVLLLYYLFRSGIFKEK